MSTPGVLNIEGVIVYGVRSASNNLCSRLLKMTKSVNFGSGHCWASWLDILGIDKRAMLSGMALLVNLQCI